MDRWNRLRIAILGPVFPYRGGIAHYTAALTHALTKRGHVARVFNFTRQYPRFLFPGKQQTDDSTTPLEVHAERVVDSLNPLTWWRAARRVRSFSPDLLVVQWWHPFFAPSFGSIARAVRRATGAPVVFVCHNVRPHEASRVDDQLLRWAYRGADGFVVQAENEATSLRSLVGESRPIEVVPHPTYDALAELERRPSKQSARAGLGIDEPHVVLFFGLVRAYKGLMTLIEAIPHVETPGVHWRVAGEFYDNPAPYRSRIDALGLVRRVTIDDRYIPNEEVGTYFAAADLVALPYRHATQSGILQLAWAYGVPAVISAVGGIPDVVEDGQNGLLVPPNDPPRLAAAIDRYFRDDLGEGLSEGIAAKRAEMGWDTVVDALESLEASTVASGPRPP